MLWSIFRLYDRSVGVPVHLAHRVVFRWTKQRNRAIWWFQSLQNEMSWKEWEKETLGVEVAFYSVRHKMNKLKCSIKAMHIQLQTPASYKCVELLTVFFLAVDLSSWPFRFNTAVICFISVCLKITPCSDIQTHEVRFSAWHLNISAHTNSETWIWHE